jgi:hypothetical protein
MKTTLVLMALIAFIPIGRPVIAAETDGQNQKYHEQATPMVLKMHERMEVIQKEMKNIHATEDASERHRLMHDHMQSMREAMMIMHTMDRPMVPHGSEGDVCMEQRMELMRLMTEQMMEYQSVQDATVE